MKFISILSFLTFLIPLLSFYSCAGYRFRNMDNPLAQDNIKTLSIPMFFNRSSTVDVAGPLTKEITLLMSRYPKLKVYPGQANQTDAILIGIIESRDHMREVVTTTTTTPIEVRNRRKFYVPNNGAINLTLRLILIKNPTHQDVEMFLSPLGKYLYKNPKIIFNESLGMSTAFGREVAMKTGPDEAGVVNFTKNKGNIEKQIQEMSKNAANNFREMILYAF